MKDGKKGINLNQFDLSKVSSGISRLSFTKKEKSEGVKNIFDLLDKKDGNIGKKLTGTNLANIFNIIEKVDTLDGKGDKILTDAELELCKKELIGDEDVSLKDFKKAILKVLNMNKSRYINSNLGAKDDQSDVRIIDAKNLAFRESNLENVDKLKIKKRKTKNINNSIDGFSQGKRGDCYLVAEINAIANTKHGEVLLNEHKTSHPDGSYTIELPGALKLKEALLKKYPDKVNDISLTGVYKITPEAIEQAWKLAGDTYSKGDLDVILYEVAFEAYRMELKETSEGLNLDKSIVFALIDPIGMVNVIKKSDILSGGLTHDAAYILTGQKSEDYSVKDGSFIEFYEKGKYGFITYEQMIKETSNTDLDPEKLSYYYNEEINEDTNLNPDKNNVNNTLSVIKNINATYIKVTNAFNNSSELMPNILNSVSAQTIDNNAIIEGLQKCMGNEENYAITASVFVGVLGDDGVTEAGGGHAITVVKITNDTVYVLNPWFAEDKKSYEAIPIEDFLKICNRLTIQEIPKPELKQN